MLVDIDEDSADKIVVATLKGSISSLSQEIKFMLDNDKAAGVWSYDVEEDMEKCKDMIRAMELTLTWYEGA